MSYSAIDQVGRDMHRRANRAAAAVRQEQQKQEQEREQERMAIPAGTETEVLAAAELGSRLLALREDLTTLGYRARVVEGTEDGRTLLDGQDVSNDQDYEGPYMAVYVYL